MISSVQTMVSRAGRPYGIVLCTLLLGPALLTSGVQAQTDANKRLGLPATGRPLIPTMPSPIARPGIPSIPVTGRIGMPPSAYLFSGQPGRVFTRGLPYPGIPPYGFQQPYGNNFGSNGGAYAPGVFIPVSPYGDLYGGFYNGGQTIPYFDPNAGSVFLPGGSLPDNGGLTNLNSPSLLARPHNPIDPGHMTHLNRPSLLTRESSPIDPGHLMELNRPSVAAGLGDSQRRFRHSTEGFDYAYDNGIYGRDRLHCYTQWGSLYFPEGCAYFPTYYPTFTSGVTCASPYGYYFGALPSYIGLDTVTIAPPAYVYVPVPVYQGGRYQGYQQDDVDGYYLNKPQDPSNPEKSGQGTYRVGEEKSRQDVQLEAARKEIERAWIDQDIQKVARHIRRDARVAVTLRGKYQYSLDASDYLDMTRDALRATKTVRFTLDQVTRKQKDTYTVNGTHVYTDQEGAEHTVHISYVLEKEGDTYYITQVGSAPDKAKP